MKTAEIRTKFLQIEKGEYESEHFFAEIKELITTLISTYQIISDAEVLMHPVSQAIGKCPCWEVML